MTGRLVQICHTNGMSVWYLMGVVTPFSQVNCDLVEHLLSHSSCCKNSWVLKYSGMGSSYLAIIL